VVPSDFGPFFAATAAVAGALIGLLFVAISVAPGRDDPAARVVTDVRAGIAFSALVNTLAVSLFALVPGASLGVTVVVVSLVSLSSCAALGIVLVREAAPGPGRGRQSAYLVAQSLVFVYEVIVGIQLARNPNDVGSLKTVCTVLIVLFLVGIARAWQLIGARDTGLITEVGHSVRSRSRRT
jgi:hypothetical protein